MPPKAKNEDEYMTANQVRELLEKQKDSYKEMLLQQESNFKGFVKIIMDSMNVRLDGVVKDIQELKASLQFTQKDVDKLTADQVKLSTDCTSLRKDTSSISESMQTAGGKTEYLEGQSRRNNLVFDGIQESHNETWAESESKIMKLLSDKLQLNQKEIELERAHRIGKLIGGGTSGNRPRPIVAKFLRYKDKLMVQEKATKLKGTGIYINEDFTEAVRQRRKELLPAMKAARLRGDIAYLRYDKLVVHPPSINHLRRSERNNPSGS